MSNFIFLNSKDRQGGDNSDCVFFFGNYEYYRGDVDISVESFDMLNFQYPVRSVNNTIVFAENGNPAPLFTATLTEGSYTATTLATEIATQMTAAGAQTYTVTYNTIPRTYTITGSGTFSLSATSTALDIMGFSSELSEDYTTFTLSKIGNCPVNVSGDDYIDVELTNFQNGNLLSSYVSNSIFHRIPLDQDFGQTIHYQNAVDHVGTRISGESLNSVKVRLLNPDGEIYYVPPNINWSLVLKIKPSQ